MGGGFNAGTDVGVPVVDVTPLRTGTVEIWQEVDALPNMGYDYTYVDVDSRTTTMQKTYVYDDGSVMTVTESGTVKIDDKGNQWFRVDSDLTTYHATPSTDYSTASTQGTNIGDTSPTSGSLPDGASGSWVDTDWDDWGQLDDAAS